MDRRSFISLAVVGGIALGSGAAATVGAEAVGAQVRHLKLPPTVALVRQLYLAPGSFTTPCDHPVALACERLGLLERTAEAGAGVWWALTPLGLREAARWVERFPTGVLAGPLASAA